MPTHIVFFTDFNGFFWIIKQQVNYKNAGRLVTLCRLSIIISIWEYNNRSTSCCSLGIVVMLKGMPVTVAGYRGFLVSCPSPTPIFVYRKLSRYFSSRCVWTGICDIHRETSVGGSAIRSASLDM